jgi:phosphatidyl-myo-inositol dimannoside synthase
MMTIPEDQDNVALTKSTKAEGVLIVAERALPSRGGLAVATSRLAEQAAQRGENVHVLALSKEAPPGGVVTKKQESVTYHYLGLLPTEEEIQSSLLDYALEIVEREQLSLVHGIYAIHAGYTAVLAARILGKASMVSLRGNDLDRGIFRNQDFPFVSWALSHATVVTGVSRPLCQKAYGLVPRNIHFVPNSVDSERFRPEARDNSLVASLKLGQDPVIGFSGELREKKGMRYLLPAFADVARRRNVRMLLIGGTRQEMSEAWEEFCRLVPEAAERIHVMDYDRSPKRLSRLFALCDMFVFPSLREGLPNAVLEVMSAARPVLATAVGGHLDIIDHGVTGALLPLSDLDLLPQAMEEFLDLPEERRNAMGKAARAYVEQNHAPSQESQRYGNLYQHARQVVGQAPVGTWQEVPVGGDPT